MHAFGSAARLVMRFVAGSPAERKKRELARLRRAVAEKKEIDEVEADIAKAIKFLSDGKGDGGTPSDTSPFLTPVKVEAVSGHGPPSEGPRAPRNAALASATSAVAAPPARDLMTAAPVTPFDEGQFREAGLRWTGDEMGQDGHLPDYVRDDAASPHGLSAHGAERAWAAAPHGRLDFWPGASAARGTVVGLFFVPSAVARAFALFHVVHRRGGLHDAGRVYSFGRGVGVPW
mmetsp:Transcript_954/g.3062  ORF Transcript_954/g.3062 Transcript_954/m.3062 type:complete len:232 (+) Transcript_954:53-748(+)